MTQTTRIGIGIFILLVIVGVVLGVDSLRRQNNPNQAIKPGEIPIYVDGELKSGFSPEDLTQLDKVNFVEAEEGKKQQGWLLRDVLLLSLEESSFQADTFITVSSSSRNKSVQMSWPEVSDPANMVMFDLSNKGTLKLVSLLEKLNTRDEWVQDTDKIEITNLK